MPYATLQDMIDRFGERELGQIAQGVALEVIDADRVERALADASAEIDGYVGTRYPLPLAPVPALLTRAACDVARYRLYDDAAPEEVRRRYEDVARLLRHIAEGTVSLGERPGTPTVPQVVQMVERSGNAVFRRRTDGGLR